MEKVKRNGKTLDDFSCKDVKENAPNKNGEKLNIVCLCKHSYHIAPSIK